MLTDWLLTDYAISLDSQPLRKPSYKDDLNQLHRTSSPRNSATDDDVLREHELFLVQQLNNIKEKRSDMMLKQKQKRLSSTDDIVEPPVDYSSGSGTDDIFIDSNDNTGKQLEYPIKSRSTQPQPRSHVRRKIPPVLGRDLGEISMLFLRI